jgi:hypothetical protein
MGIISGAKTPSVEIEASGRTTTRFVSNLRGPDGTGFDDER